MIFAPFKTHEKLVVKKHLNKIFCNLFVQIVLVESFCSLVSKSNTKNLGYFKYYLNWSTIWVSFDIKILIFRRFTHKI